MRPVRLVWSLLVMVLTALAFTNCSDDSGGCEPGMPCRCTGARGCIYDCPETGCLPLCSDVDFCSATCGADCGYTCSRVSACDVDCGAGCDTACMDVSDCRARVGPESTVTCDRLSNCDVTCDGSCRVTCSSVGACNVNCSTGSSTDCGGGVHVCGLAC